MMRRHLWGTVRTRRNPMSQMIQMMRSFTVGRMQSPQSAAVIIVGAGHEVNVSQSKDGGRWHIVVFSVAKWHARVATVAQQGAH